ncbi:MAG TPA: AraC family transcriptional regulator [Clostridia bacterium]
MYESELKYCMNINYPEKYVVKQHRHNCYELVYYISGSGETIINTKRYPFEKDTFSLICPEEPHCEIGNNSVEVLYIGFNVLSKNVRLETGLYKNTDFDILEDLYLIKQESDEKREFYNRMLNILTERILIKLSRPKIASLKSPENDQLMREITEYIKKEWRNDISIRDIAKHFNYSYDHFRNLFQKNMGISIKDYIMNEKLNYAVELMQNTNYTIAEIAKICHFASPSHFSMFFKQKMNMTPLEYLKSFESEKKQWKLTKYD